MREKLCLTLWFDPSDILLRGPVISFFPGHLASTRTSTIQYANFFSPVTLGADRDHLLALVQHHAVHFLLEGTYDRRAELLSASLRHCAAFLAAGHRINIFKADGG